jgi:hypothetical protein
VATQSNARGAIGGVSKTRRAITFLRAGCKLQAALLWEPVVDGRGAGSAAKSFAASISTPRRVDVPWTHETFIQRNAAASSVGLIRTTIVAGVTTVTANGVGDGGCFDGHTRD